MTPTLQRFYGYRHWTKEAQPRCFYVGEGVKNRPYSHERNHKWRNVVKNYCYTVEVCVGPMTKEESLAWEVAMIEEMGTFTTNHTHDDSTQISCNFDKGGRGCAGHIVSPESRKKMSDVRKGNENCRGWVLTDETKKKMSETKKGEKNPNYGKPALNKGKSPSDETRKKMSDAKKNPSIETRQKLSTATLGRRHTEATRKKMSEDLKGDKNPFYGKSHTEETRQKMSIARRRRPPPSAETRKKLSDANKRRWDRYRTSQITSHVQICEPRDRSVELEIIEVIDE